MVLHSAFLQKSFTSTNSKGFEDHQGINIFVGGKDLSSRMIFFFFCIYSIILPLNEFLSLDTEFVLCSLTFYQSLKHTENIWIKILL